jgi:hypothetical protein
MEVLIMSNIPEQDSYQIVTLDDLKVFRQELLNSIGVKLGNNNSIIQLSNDKVYKVANSAFIGEGHKTPDPTTNEDGTTSRIGLKNIFVAGHGNSVNAWNQSVFGTFNKEVKEALFIVGNGTSDFIRNNVLEVHTDGTFKVHDVSFKPQESQQLKIDGKLLYESSPLTNVDIDSLGWTDFYNYINSLTDTELISADVVKLICNKVNQHLKDNPNIDGSWSNNLVQHLLQISSSDEVAYNNITADASKALSLKDGQFLYQLINKYRDDAAIVDLKNQLNLLKRQISYLISCLTVDKLTTADTEYYAVGIADYALDYDTKFKISDTDTSSILALFENDLEQEGSDSIFNEEQEEE